MKTIPILGVVPALGLALGLGLGITALDARDRTFGDQLPRYIRQFDANEDGLIDEEERQALRAARDASHASWLSQWDSDRNGELSATERERALDAIRAEIEAVRRERFAELAGEDGCLDVDEFAAIPGLLDVEAGRVAALFHRLDADDDGCVRLEEFTARLRHHRKPGRPAPPSPRPAPNEDQHEGGRR